MPKVKPDLTLVEDDEDLDEFFDEEDDDDEDLDEDEVAALLDEDDEEEDEPAPTPKKRPGSKRGNTSAKAQEPPVDDEDDEETFEQVLSQPNSPSRTPALKSLDDDQLVIELSDLVLAGDENEMVSILHGVITGLRGGKVAKQLVREARDRAIAKIKRVANVAQLTIDYLDKGDD